LASAFRKATRPWDRSASPSAWTTPRSARFTNLAARLCGDAKDRQILISRRVATAVEGTASLEEIGDLSLKGLSQAVGVYNVVAVDTPYQRPDTSEFCCDQRQLSVMGFGCRPVVTYQPVLRAGVRKPPRKEPAGAG
jgi:hypothetical protein